MPQDPETARSRAGDRLGNHGDVTSWCTWPRRC